MATRATGAPSASDPASPDPGGPDQERTAQIVFDDRTEEVPAVAGTPSGPSPSTWRRLGRRRLVIAAVVVVLAAGAGLGIWLGTGSGGGTGLKVVTQVVSVATGTMQQTVSTTGTVAPAHEADLDFAVSGKVTAVDVTVGQTVTAGQALATVASTALQATADAAQASLTSAQAKLASDRAGGASTSQILSDEAAVTSAQSQLTSAQTDLADATLTSTIAGTVASVDLTVGQQVSGSGSGNGGAKTSSGDSGDSSPQVTVISTDTFVVNTTVDDTQVGKIAAGDQAVITPTDATTPAYGTVASVGMIASGSSGVASFPVVVDVTGTPSGVHAGASASVSIVVQQLDDVVEVPTAAISYGNGHATVTVVKDGRHVPTAVTTGQTSDGDTQITHGVTAGEKVVEKVVTFTGTPSGAKNGFPGGGKFPGGGVHVFHITGPRGGGAVSVSGGAPGPGQTGGGTGGTGG